MYWYVLVCTSTDKYREVHTCMYWLVLVCTSTYQEFLDLKKVQTGLEPMILCILLVYFTTALQAHSERILGIYQVNVCVFIELVLFMSVYLALDDELTAPDPPRRAPQHPPAITSRSTARTWIGTSAHDGPTAGPWQAATCQ